MPYIEKHDHSCPRCGRKYLTSRIGPKEIWGICPKCRTPAQQERNERLIKEYIISNTKGGKK